MAPKSYLGEFEQMLLLAIMQRGEEATGLAVRRELEESVGRSVSKGAFYTTLDRLEKKDLVSWVVRPPENSASNLPQRHFSVTPEGVAELQKSRDALLTLWSGLEGVLGGH